MRRNDVTGQRKIASYGNSIRDEHNICDANNTKQIQPLFSLLRLPNNSNKIRICMFSYLFESKLNIVVLNR